MEKSVIKYLQIYFKPPSLSYKIHKTKTLTIKSPNTNSNSFKNTKFTILRKYTKTVHQLA